MPKRFDTHTYIHAYIHTYQTFWHPPPPWFGGCYYYIDINIDSNISILLGKGLDALVQSLYALVYLLYGTETFPPETKYLCVGCSEGLDAFRFFFKVLSVQGFWREMKGNEEKWRELKEILVEICGPYRSIIMGISRLEQQQDGTGIVPTDDV